MSPERAFTRETLEESWRLRLKEAEAKYHEAQKRHRTLLKEQPVGTPQDPNGALALAREAESRVRAEYARVLHAFTELTLHGKIPDDRSGPLQTAYEFRFRQNLSR